FNVSYAAAVPLLTALERTLHLGPRFLFVGVLWPGDWWVPAINYPAEADDAVRCGERLEVRRPHAPLGRRRLLRGAQPRLPPRTRGDEAARAPRARALPARGRGRRRLSRHAPVHRGARERRAHLRARLGRGLGAAGRVSGGRLRVRRVLPGSRQPVPPCP